MIAIDSSTRLGQDVRGPILHTLHNFLVDFLGADFAQLQVIKHSPIQVLEFFLSESLKVRVLVSFLFFFFICVYWFFYRNRCKPFQVLHFRVTP